MKKFLLTLRRSTDEEVRQTALMFLYGLLNIATLSVLKPVAHSLFLIRFGAERLPGVYMLVAVFSAGFAVAYARYSRSWRLTRIIQATLTASSLTLLIFWILLSTGFRGHGLLYGLYIFTAIFGVFSGSQFWLLANEIYDARQAKRFFGLIGAGAITGGILGGYLTNFLAPRLRTENLLLFCIGFLLAGGALVRRIQPAGKRRASSSARFPGHPHRPPSSDRKILSAVFSSRHLVYLAGILTVGMIVADLANYQFSALASQALPEADRLTAFFGFWLSTVNLISLVVQVFFTGRVLKNLGVTAALFFLPLGLLLGSGAVLAVPALWSAVVLRIGGGGFKHSINKAGLELLALPIPPDLKSRAKALIDVFARNSARGLGGLLLIILTAGLGFAVPHISLINIALIGLWAGLILRGRRTYVDAFRHAIEKQSIDPDALPLNLEDASMLQNLLKALENRSKRQVLYALRLLEGTRAPELIPHLRRLIDHESADIRAQALRMSSSFPELDLAEQARAMIKSEDLQLQTEGVCYLYQAADNPGAAISGLVRDSRDRVRAAAMLCAASEWRERRDFREAIDMDVLLDGMMERSRQDDLEEEESRHLKLQTARALGRMKDPEYHHHLETLMSDSCPAVQEAAVESAGEAAALPLIPALIEHLKTRHLRKCSRDALIEFGEDVIEPLAARLSDPGTDPRIRRAIPRVLAGIESPRSPAVLLDNLKPNEHSLRTVIIQALNRALADFPALRIESAVIRGKVLEEGRLFRAFLMSWSRMALALRETGPGRREAHSKNDLRARRLLVSALSERLDVCLERILRLLGLEYSIRDMLNTYHGLKSRDPRLRANAVEFLDNVLDPGLKRMIVPLVESGLPGIRGKQPPLRGLKGLPSEQQSLQRILKEEDNWLRAVALFLLAVRRDHGFIEDVRPFAETADPLVRETARLYLDNLKSDADR